MSDLTTSAPFDQIKQARSDGSEYWSARDLQPHLGYDQWRRFEDSIERANAAISNSGLNPEDHIATAGKMIELGKGATRYLHDYQLTRYACYVVAMNGDPRKPEVAGAQTYFAVKTREAEISAPALPQDYPSALRALAAEVESKAALEAQAQADAPKVGYVDQYVTDGDLLKLRTVASNLGAPESELRALLLVKGWIYVETSSRWSNKRGCKEEVRRYSAYADKKRYFTPVENHEAPRFKGEVMHTLKVTPAGAEAISRLWRRTRQQTQLELVGANTTPEGEWTR